MQHHSSPEFSEQTLAAETAIARSRLYALVGNVYQFGLTPELLPVVQAIEEFALTLSSEYAASEAAAAHQRIFGFALFAHESIFLDPSGMLGGPTAEKVATHYAELGYPSNSNAADGDHLGAELTLLAHLCGAEAEAWEDGEQAQAIRMQAAQCRFMQNHLLQWIAPCLWAIRQEGDPFYSAVAEVTWDLVSDHYTSIAKLPAWAIELPAPPTLLSDPKTSLRDIAEFLMTPCYSGLFLSRTAVGELGRALQLPRGFADRTTMLVNLMQSAAQYDGSLALLEQLIAKFEATSRWYNSCRHGSAKLDFALQPWIERTEATVNLLGEMRKRAGEELR